MCNALGGARFVKPIANWPDRAPAGRVRTAATACVVHSKRVRGKLLRAELHRSVGAVDISEHDESDPTADEELFLVLRGQAVFEVDGDRVDAPAGTLVFAPPRTKRMAFAKEDGTTIIGLEGTPGKAYEARGWELWAPLAPLYQAAEYGEVVDRLAPLVAANPQHPMLFFNLACCESLSGGTCDALDHLRHAIEMSEELRHAKDDSDLDPIRNEPAFNHLISD